MLEAAILGALVGFLIGMTLTHSYIKHKLGRLPEPRMTRIHRHNYQVEPITCGYVWQCKECGYVIAPDLPSSAKHLPDPADEAF